MTPRIKICCIATVEEARMAIGAGASAIGLVSAMPSGPGPIPVKTIREIAESVPPGIDTFLLTCLQEARGIIDQHKRCGTNTIQLVDRVKQGTYKRLRAGLPGVAIVQVIHITGPESVDEALQAAPHVDALLLDSGNPGFIVKELGGTGRVHDWQISRRIRNSVSIPVYLAGGLNAFNATAAIERVSPYALDVCSGVRTNGTLDPVKVSAFMSAVKSIHG